jgi:hypothetical protein
MKQDRVKLPTWMLLSKMKCRWKLVDEDVITFVYKEMKGGGGPVQWGSGRKWAGAAEVGGGS